MQHRRYDVLQEMTTPTKQRCGAVICPTYLENMARPFARQKLGYFGSFVRFFKDKDASLLGKLFVLATLGYVVWPIDLIPDFAPVIGWLDDLGMATVAMVYLTRVSAKYRLAPQAEQLALPVVEAPTLGTWPQGDAYAPARKQR